MDNRPFNINWGSHILVVLSTLQLCASFPIIEKGNLIVMPYPKLDANHSDSVTIHAIKSFGIDGPTLMRHISPDAILRAIAEIPELDNVVNSLDYLTLGELYRSVFPDGAISASNERVLKRLGITTVSLQSSRQQAGPQFDSNVFDRVGVDFDNEKKPMRDGTITDDYMYDQPEEERVLLDHSQHKILLSAPEVESISAIEQTINETPNLSLNHTETSIPNSPNSSTKQPSPSVIQRPSLSSSKPSETKIEPKTSETQIQPLLAEDPVSEMSTQTTIKPDSPLNKPTYSKLTSDSNQIVFNSDEAGAKLRDWISRYFSTA